MPELITMNERAQERSDEIIKKLENIFDPEIGLDIYNLGLVYDIQLSNDGLCEVTTTFTGIGCDCIESVPGEIKEGLLQIDGVTAVDVKIVWSPAWKMTRISRFGRIALGINPG